MNKHKATPFRMQHTLLWIIPTLLLEHRLGLGHEQERAADPEGDEERDEDPDVEADQVRLDSVSFTHAPAEGEVSIALVTHVVVELDEDGDVHGVLERAKVLGPADELGDGVRADEEAGEEQLRHEHEGQKLGRGLDVSHCGAEERGHGGGGHAESEGGQRDQDEVRPELDEVVPAGGASEASRRNS